jgi:hypothetical protein
MMGPAKNGVRLGDLATKFNGAFFVVADALRRITLAASFAAFFEPSAVRDGILGQIENLVILKLW